ncbi:acetate uptake transporter [Methanobacterium paludis]|uniref:GPR1/FUN34/yaaH family protein n=1 Tax=Methanobacterium paludis (strain DSM 25820 / JCM 18151 / SWAN1) TaxID=868131 RepID=F6D7T4_METPW|nr:GPR1/FUN34/YaaH family transporter [Methanobacterium paludis]AEG17772.1 GPR1/FUN34/yaaH family protein [Methanobacterium paludis]
MVENQNKITLKDTTANPAPLGLLGFGLTTVLLNFHNAGFYPMSSMILSMGFAYGGIAQIIASVMEYKKGNTFGMVAFGSYGLFWWSLVFLLMVPSMTFFSTAAKSPVQAADPASLAAYFFMWGIFTLGMFVGTLKKGRGLQVVFITLAVLFFLLTAGEITGIKTITLIAGYEGIFTGLSAVYVGLAEVINEEYGRRVLPV